MLLTELAHDSVDQTTLSKEFASQLSERAEVDLGTLYRRGFIPGPDETKDVFFKRFWLSQKSMNWPGTAVPAEDWKAAYEITRLFYDIAPDWVPAFFSSKGLMWWEAGAAFELGNGQWVIQLNDKRGLASRAEVLAHEAVHTARSAFQEKRFEELLAYRTSPKVWRRLIGPLLRHSWETWLMMIGVLVDMGMIWNGKYFCFTFLFLGILSLRLCWDQWRLFCCLKRLPKSSIALCLTDREIIAIAKGTEFLDLDDGSLRWKMMKSHFK